MREAELVIVGGGPAGLIAAYEAARLGLNVNVLEEDAIIGRPERCAGLYSLRGIDRIGVELRRSYLQNLIWGGMIYSPSGETVEVRSSTPVAVVAEREAFDRFLGERALRAGVELSIGSRVLSCKLGGDSGHCSVLLEGGGELEAGAVIIAEGSSTTLSRRIFKNYYAPFWLPIVQIVVKGHGLDKKFAHVWFKDYLRDFFGYLVPINEELGKLGVAASKDPLGKAQKLMKDVMPSARVLGYSSHSIYRGPPLEFGLEGRIILVGDAAGQVKATTGGGVVMGGLCARAAASHVYRLLREGVDGTYRTSTRGIYRELKATYWVSRALLSLSIESLDRLIKGVKESGLEKSLSMRGDMDFQVKGVLKSLATAQGVKFLSYLLRSLI